MVGGKSTGISPQYYYVLSDIHTHPFNGPFSGTTQVSRYQKGKTSLDFTEARDSEWQWHQLGHMQVCTSIQTDNHASTPLLRFLQTGCPSCRPTNSVKALSDIAEQYWLPSVRSAASRFHSAIRRHQFASVRQADSRLTRLVPPNLGLALTPLIVTQARYGTGTNTS